MVSCGSVRIRIHIAANFPLCSPFPTGADPDPHHSKLSSFSPFPTGEWKVAVKDRKSTRKHRFAQGMCIHNGIFTFLVSSMQLLRLQVSETIQEINTLQHTQHRLYFRCLFFLNIVEKYLNNALQEPNRIKINVRKCTAIMCQFFVVSRTTFVLQVAN